MLWTTFGLLAGVGKEEVGFVEGSESLALELEGLSGREDILVGVFGEVRFGICFCEQMVLCILRCLKFEETPGRRTSNTRKVFILLDPFPRITLLCLYSLCLPLCGSLVRLPYTISLCFSLSSCFVISRQCEWSTMALIRKEGQ